MLRIIHSQTTAGALLIDDIDDGLPNKNVHRLGSTADPNAYVSDGYANKPKQSCYVARVKASNPAIAGYIDLEETDRVLLSADHGKIKGFSTVGLASVLSFVKSDIATPNVTSVTQNAPAPGDITIAGTGFLSLLPEITSVHLVGPGVGDVTLTQAQIVAVAPGAVTDIQIIIDSTLIAGLVDGDTVQVSSDGLLGNVFALTTVPAVTLAQQNLPAPGDLTLTGTGFLSFAPEITSVIFAGAGVGNVTLTEAQILAVPPGAVTNVSIVIDTTLIPGLVDGDTVQVSADGELGNVVTLTTVPNITAVTLNAPAPGDATIDGTGFLSFLPEITSVTLAGAGVGNVTLTEAQVIAVPPGAVTDTQIIIDSTLIAGLAPGDTVQAFADGETGNVFVVV